MALSARALTLSTALGASMLFGGLCRSKTIANPTRPAIASPGAIETITDIVEVTDISSLAISPDGRMIAFRTVRASVGDNRYHMRWYVAPLDGSAPARPIADGGDPDINSGVVVSQTPVWAPSSGAFFFRAIFNGQDQVWRAALKDQAARQVTRDPANIRAIALSDDGKSVVYTVGASRAKVAQAEQDILDNGVLIDGTTDLTNGLSRSAVVDGQPATMQFAKGWFTRQPLLWEKAAHQEKFSLPSDDYTDRPSPLAGLTVRIEAEGDNQRLHWVDAEHVDHRCESPSCPTDHMRAAVPLRDGHTVLVSTADSERYDNLWIWTPVTDKWRKLVPASGSLDGGSIIPTDCSVSDNLVACVEATPAGPPRLVAIDVADGRKRILFDPNASLRSRALSAQELYWHTSKSLEVAGQLLLPPGSRPKGGFPLVIDYYSCDGFLRGGLGDELPLAPLAETGIATLCINQVHKAGKTEQDWEDTAVDAISTIIGQLADKGIIDRERVGEAGLSFGSQITMAMLERTSLIRVAAIASAQVDNYYYWNAAIPGRDVRSNLKDFFGIGDPDTDIAGWKAHTAVGNVAHIKAPLLMQLPESEMRLAVELYARLANSPTPVEMYAYPNETHIKWEPRHKLAVYERNLDWFRFWLLGQEDPDPAKLEQYSRWRAFTARPGYAVAKMKY